MIIVTIKITRILITTAIKTVVLISLLLPPVFFTFILLLKIYIAGGGELSNPTLSEVYPCCCLFISKLLYPCCC